MNHKLHAFFIGKQTLKQRLPEALLPALALSFTLFFFGPLDLAGKAEDFVNFTALELLPSCLAIWFAVFAVLFLAAWLTGGRFHTWLVSIYCGLAIAFYFEAHGLNPDLGILDGTAIDWIKYADRALIGLVIFIAILLIPLIIRFFSRKFWQNFVLLSSVTLTLMQALPLGTFLFKELSAQRTKDYTRCVVAKENEYVLGSDKNIIVFILDNVSHGDLAASLGTYPDMLVPLNDFIYFDNMTTQNVGTFPSVTYLLTHQVFDFANETPAEYFDRAWHSVEVELFYQQLHETGWNVDIYNQLQHAAGQGEYVLGKFSNISQTSEPPRFSIDLHALKKLYYLSFYRYFPLIAKAIYWIDTDTLSEIKLVPKNEREWNPYRSVANFWEDGIRIGDNSKMYHSYHYSGAHFPFNLDESGHIIYDGNGSDAVIQLAGHFRLIAEYIRKMKELGVYDSATLIITTDHGKLYDPSAIFFIKPANRHADKMETSHAPVTQGEYMETIAQAAGLPAGQFGRSVFEVGEDEVIERCSLIRGYDSSFSPAAKGKHENLITEYCTTGNSEQIRQMIARGDGVQMYNPNSFY